jgi:MBG domain (YGX type)/Immunoglobulin domain
MKKGWIRGFLRAGLAAAGLFVVPANAQTVTLQPNGATNFVGCQVVGAGGNNINNAAFLHIPDSLSSFSGAGLNLYVYDCSSGAFRSLFYVDAADAMSFGLGQAGWYDNNTFNYVTNVTWNPGQGMAMFSYDTQPDTINLNGTSPPPVLPPASYCGCGSWSFLSSQTTNAIGTYQDVTGFSPETGAEVSFQLPGGGGFVANARYTNGAWVPGVPILSGGHAAFFFIPCQLGVRPTINVTPQSQTNTIGSQVIFSVSAGGTLPLAYQWKFNGAILTNGGQISGAQSNILTLNNITVSNAGTYTVVVMNAYGSTNAAASLTIQAATPSLTWPAPAFITYGTVLDTNQLDASAGVPGTFAYSPPAGSVLNAGTNILSVVFTPDDTVDYSVETDSVSLVVLPAPLNVTANSFVRAFGQTNPVFTGTITGLQNGDDITAGYYCAAVPSSPPAVYPITPLLFDPGNLLANYDVSVTPGTLTVTPASFVEYEIQGDFDGRDWLIIQGQTVQYEHFDFIPVGLSNPAYPDTIISSSFNGVPVMTNVSWTPSWPDGTGSGSFSSPYQGLMPPLPLNPGSVTLDVVTGRGPVSIVQIPSDSNTNTLIVEFNDDDFYLDALYDVKIDISTATPGTLLTWTNPAPITYGTALDTNQLDAMAGVPGTYVYSPPAGSVLDAGTNVLSVVFTPDDTVDYSAETDSVSLVVLPAPLNVTVDSFTRAFGQTNPVFTGTISNLQNGDNITATYNCAAALASPPAVYPILPLLLDPGNLLGNYILTVTPGALTVTSGAQVLAHDDAAAYELAGGTWSNGMNFGYGFVPWVIQTSGPATQGSFIGDGNNIATISNSAWGLYADGQPLTNMAVAFRGFSNSLPIGESLKLEWRTGDIGFNTYNFAGFSLRTGNASGSTADYTAGEQFAFFYHGGGDNTNAQDDVTIRDGSGERYAPAPGVSFGSIHQGIAIEFTLLSSSTYRLVVMDAATSNVLALFDNRLLEGAGSIDSVALFDNQTDGGGGEYDGNQLYNDLEIATPSIGVPPTVSLSPGSLAVAPGAAAVFTANATGTTPLVYQWLFNGADISGANDSTLSIPGVQVGNGGNYQVVITSPYGSLTSLPSTLAVLTPTTILQPPASAQTTVGGTATFAVVAVSSSPLGYQWFFGAAAVPGATNSSYAVVDAQLSDQGTYTVQISNLAGSVVSASAALLVLPAPPPLVPTFSYTINIQAGTNLIANQLNQSGNTLKEIMPVVPDGTVVSKYDNTNGSWASSTYNAASHAWVPSSIVLRPGEGAQLISPIGFSLTFSGTANVPVLPLAIPEGEAWLVSRQTNDTGTYESITGTSPAPGAVFYKWDPISASYTLYTYSLSGWSGGTEPTATVGESVWIGPTGGEPVPIPEPPVITQQPVGLSVAQGGTAAFSVVATGTSPLFYQWQVNGNGISGETNSTFTIPDVQAANVGNYSVTINNSIGITNSSIAPLTIPGLGTLPVADNFTNAGSLGASTNGSGTASNVGATTEAGEPSPDNILFGASVWLVWQPEVSGLASLTTAGSDFDTVLGVFTGNSLSNLDLVAADDDSGPNLCAALSFNAVAGTSYFIQISGFHGAEGNILLSWNLAATNTQVPVILVQPQSQTQTNGGLVALSVVATNIAPAASYQWFLLGAPIPSATNSTLTISNLSPDQVGLYTVAVTNLESLAGVLSASASVEIFNPGVAQPGNFANVHPQDKFLNATSLTPHDPNIPNDPSFAGGFTGTQIFSSVGSTADVGEPNHCGYAPCHSVWYSYVPPTTGLLTITTSNNFNAVLEVYSGPGNSFTNLASLACSANHGTAGESVMIGVTAATNYWVVIDGVNCASGSFTINYVLTSPPAFTVLPVGQTATNGSKVVLSASTAGSPPFGYQWFFNGGIIPGATNSSLVITNFQAANQGDYSVTTANSYGTNQSAPATLYLSSPARFVSFGVVSGTFSAEFVGAANSNYVFQASSNLADWVALATNSSPIGILNLYDPVKPGASGHFYRAAAK